MTLGNVMYVFCFVFKSCFRITWWVGNTFQVIFSRKENCNEFSFTCVKSRECISSWCLPEARWADSRIWPLSEGPVPGAVLWVPLAPSVQEPVGPWRHDAANHEYSWGGQGTRRTRHGQILQKVIGQSGHAVWAEMLLTPRKPSWVPCQCSGAAGRWAACTRKRVFVCSPHRF